MHNFELKPSKLYLLIMLVILMISIGLIISLQDCKMAIRILMILFIILYGTWIIWRFVLLRSPTSVIRIQHIDKQEWQIQLNQSHHLAILSGDSIVTPWLSILRFKISGEFWKPSCVIFSDSL